MPDWFYRTVSQPILLRLPPEPARKFVLSFMASVASVPSGLGGRLIDFLGHMRPADGLKRTVAGAELTGPVGLGSLVDPGATALGAWSRFGFSVIEVGPVSPQPTSPIRKLRGDRVGRTIEASPGNAGIAVDEVKARLKTLPARPVKLLVRVACPPGGNVVRAVSEIQRTCVALSDFVWAFAIELPGDSGLVNGFLVELGKQMVAAGISTWFVVVAPEAAVDLCREAKAHGAKGCIISTTVASGAGGTFGRRSLPALGSAARAVRSESGDSWAILTSGGVHEPADAEELVGAGADVCLIDSGFVFTGPGLPKRINELVDAIRSRPPVSVGPPPRMAEQSWFWALLLGTAMLIGSILALTIASTRVVLPYDEEFCGWTRPEIEAHNPRLLPFLTHDRVCLAGSMIAIGLTYVSLAWHGIRRGMHWARIAVISSAGSGFASFFLFLGFGYLDPFHAFVTAILSQLFALAIFGKETTPAPPRALDRTTDATWIRGQWGQFLLILHAVALMVAGLSIAGIGVTNVLVWTDLNFLGTSLEGMKAANPKLLPLVAHDRATFGGMLIALGLAWLLSLLWGFQKAEAWLWWSKLGGGATFYAAALGVHFHVGYVDLWHLVPASAGAALMGLGLFLSRSWLLGASDGQ